MRPKWRPFSKLASIKWQNDSHADVRRRREMNFHAEGGSTAASWPHVWSGGARRDRHEGIKRDPTLSLSQCAVAVFLCPSALLHSPSISLPAPIHQSPLTESVARPHKISRRLANTISRRSGRGRGRQCSGRGRRFSLLRPGSPSFPLAPSFFKLSPIYKGFAAPAQLTPLSRGSLTRSCVKGIPSWQT